jgi:spoIIIJ-associated protein
MTRVEVEAEGNSIDEAIANALRVLGAEREQVRVEILQDARRGLLGFGGQKARVRVELRKPSQGEPVPSTQPPPQETFVVEPPAGTAGSAPHPAPPEPQGGRSLVSEDRLAEASSVLSGILERMGLEAKVEVHGASGEEPPTLRVVTPHSALVIGRHGQTLDALEYLVNRIVSRQQESSVRVAVDCQGYRARQRQGLRDTALRLAEKVRRAKKPQATQPMSPRDRRIVHLALAGRKDVVTRSVGEGYLRRVVISPARVERGPGDPENRP